MKATGWESVLQLHLNYYLKLRRWKNVLRNFVPQGVLLVRRIQLWLKTRLCLGEKSLSDMTERISPQLLVIDHLSSLCVCFVISVQIYESDYRLFHIDYFFLQYAFWMLYSLDILSSFCFLDISVVLFWLHLYLIRQFVKIIVACWELEPHFYSFKSLLHLWSYCPEFVTIKKDSKLHNSSAIFSF